MLIVKLVILSTVLMLTLSAAIAGEYNVCTGANGKKLFTSQPCPSGQNAVVKTYKKLEPSAQEGSVFNLNNNKAYTSMRDNNRSLELKRNIKKTRSNIDQLHANRDKELARLRIKKSRANNNVAGAIFEQSVSAEMATVSNLYDSKIENEQRKLDRMLDELSNY